MQLLPLLPIVLLGDLLHDWSQQHAFLVVHLDQLEGLYTMSVWGHCMHALNVSMTRPIILHADVSTAEACMHIPAKLCSDVQIMSGMQVDKILGPGNQYVTAAKMLLQNSEAMVSIDMPAGPSEVMVIADAEAPHAHIAADLLSQAEHGPDSQVWCIPTHVQACIRG